MNLYIKQTSGGSHESLVSDSGIGLPVSGGEYFFWFSEAAASSRKQQIVTLRHRPGEDLSIRKAERNLTIRIERVPCTTASMNMRLRMGSTFHLPLAIAIILCRMSPEQRETRLNSYIIRKSRLSLFFLKSRLLSKQSGLNSGKPESD